MCWVVRIFFAPRASHFFQTSATGGTMKVVTRALYVRHKVAFNTISVDQACLTGRGIVMQNHFCLHFCFL